MELKEYLETNDLITELGATLAVDFPFIDQHVKNINNGLKWLYGRGTVYSGYLDATVVDLAEVMAARFVDSWNVKLEVIQLGESVGNKQTITESIDTTENRTNETTNTNKVSGFNSATMVDNDGSTSLGDDGLIGNRTKTLTNENKNTENDLKVLNKLVKESMLSCVLEDISQFLTLSIGN